MNKQEIKELQSKADRLYHDRIRAEVDLEYAEGEERKAKMDFYLSFAHVLLGKEFVDNNDSNNIYLACFLHVKYQGIDIDKMIEENFE